MLRRAPSHDFAISHDRGESSGGCVQLLNLAWGTQAGKCLKNDGNYLHELVGFSWVFMYVKIYRSSSHGWGLRDMFGYYPVPSTCTWCITVNRWGRYIQHIPKSSHGTGILIYLHLPNHENYTIHVYPYMNGMGMPYKEFMLLWYSRILVVSPLHPCRRSCIIEN